MARDYDSQLLESVAVRRQRLREAVVFGAQRTRRRLDENIMRVFVSLCVSAVLCAGTVGWSFLQNQLRDQETEQEQAAGPPNVSAAPLPADWVGTEVTLPMLRAELDRAGVPPDLYVLPGEPRPEAGSVASYYLLTDDGDRLSAGIIEFEQGRTGAEFGTVDEAARWLYQQLVTTESGPQRLTAAEESAAREQTAETVTQAEERIAESTGGSYQHAFEPGQILDAFGPESGSLLFPDGTPFAQRGLPEYAWDGSETAGSGEPGSEGYQRYRVIHPFRATASLSPATVGSPGGAVRFRITANGFSQPPELPSIRWLLSNGYLERVEVTDVPQ
ncbi:TNT domain-containing protein [Marinactinospora rubrisoli]|uniref:TNT domain-containing protein n=1 Tax=Marinactinospora rubrisoli TaxID=2715399 RepID=A0ABW2KIS9_9ACTN